MRQKRFRDLSVQLLERPTAGYMHDGQTQTAVIEEFYPRTYSINGVLTTAGWTGSEPTLLANRDDTLDVRLAGVNGMLNSGAQCAFQVVLLQAGTWTLFLALGDVVAETSHYLAALGQRHAHRDVR